MLANLFALIQLILKALSIWEGFLDSVEEADVQKRNARRLKRDKAIDDSTKAETDEEIWKSQDEYTRNQP